MSVYRRKEGEAYSYDFIAGGVRFSGTTGENQKRRAEEIEREIRAKAKREIEKRKRGEKEPLTISRAADRYMDEVGEYHADPCTTLVNMNRLITFFGPGKRLAEITDSDVATLVRERREDTVRGRKNGKAISNATVNRSVVEPLQKLFNRATLTWGETLPKPPKWKRHLLPEPEERVREVSTIEEDGLLALRGDYRLLIEFARASGLRMSECLVKRGAVDLVDGWVNVIGKGKKVIARPMTTEMREILEQALRGNPTDFVFTYVADRTRRGHVKGQRVPITVSGLKTFWRRAKMRKAVPADLRFHDLRHDFATKLLRETGNLKTVQKALDHSKIETTSRYAHVLDEEVRAAMEAASASRRRVRPLQEVPREVPRAEGE